MDSSQAAFDILAFLMAADGNVVPAEMEILVDFVKQISEDISFNPKKEIDDLAKLSPAAIMQRYGQATEIIRVNENKKVQQAILEYAARIVLADGKVTRDEKDMLVETGKSWGIDAAEILNREKGGA